MGQMVSLVEGMCSTEASAQGDTVGPLGQPLCVKKKNVSLQKQQRSCLLELQQLVEKWDANLESHL